MSIQSGYSIQFQLMEKTGRHSQGEVNICRGMSGKCDLSLLVVVCVCMCVCGGGGHVDARTAEPLRHSENGNRVQKRVQDDDKILIETISIAAPSV